MQSVMFNHVLFGLTLPLVLVPDKVPLCGLELSFSKQLSRNMTKIPLLSVSLYDFLTLGPFQEPIHFLPSKIPGVCCNKF